MDFDFRLLLVVVGLGLIGYVAWDGWRNRARNYYKFKLEQNVPPESSQRPDRQGFTQDGVGQPRLRGHSDRNVIARQSAGRNPAEIANDDHDSDEDDSVQVEAQEAASSARMPARNEHVEPTFGEPLNAADARSRYARGMTPDLFSNLESADTVPSNRVPTAHREDTRTERAPSRRTEPDVIALTVLALDGQTFRGAELVACLLEHDLRYGEMNIFHRHADASGQGPVLFSVANALKPGTFDPDQMDNFSSPGVSLFMQLPGPQDPRMAYHLLLSTAEYLAQTLGGEVRDAARKPLSKEVRMRHQEILAEHERQLFAGA